MVTVSILTQLVSWVRPSSFSDQRVDVSILTQLVSWVRQPPPDLLFWRGL